MLENILHFIEILKIRKHTLLSSKRGATAIEFAFVAPIFIVMVFGTVEIARAMYIKSSMQYAVEETARYVMVNNAATEAEVEAEANSQFAGSSNILSGITFTADSTTSGYMDITATYTFDFLVPIVSMPQITLQAQSRTPIS